MQAADSCTMPGSHSPPPPPATGRAVLLSFLHKVEPRRNLRRRRCEACCLDMRGSTAGFPGSDIFCTLGIHLKAVGKIKSTAENGVDMTLALNVGDKSCLCVQ